jgi:protein TonB
MSIEPGPSPQNEFGSLQGCFVEGNPEQRARERRIRRRALIISVAAQAAIVTAIILVPLFAKPERILANMTPIPPYFSHLARPLADPAPTQPRRPSDPRLCGTCFSPKFPDHPATTDPPGEPTAPGFEPPDGRPGPSVPWGLNIDDKRQPPPPADVRPKTPSRVFKGHLEQAMLIQRVEPKYPPLARQIHREGHVELHAVIATDGTIQSLQVVSGDSLFLQSALNAVSQWRYRPTVLDGQPVEIETYITVIYTLQH